MGVAEFLLLLLVGWTLVGLFGVGYSVLRAESAKAVGNFGWIVAVWVAYLAVLLGFSLLQPQKTLAAGKPRCFHKLCYTVAGVEQLPGYPTQGSRLVRVQLNMQNRGSGSDGIRALQAVLVDRNGRRWAEVPGLSGVPLGISIPAGRTLLSQPVYKLPVGVEPAGVILTRDGWHPAKLLIGDADSLLHRPTIAQLPR